MNFQFEMEWLKQMFQLANIANDVKNTSFS